MIFRPSLRGCGDVFQPIAVFLVALLVEPRALVEHHRALCFAKGWHHPQVDPGDLDAGATQAADRFLQRRGHGSFDIG